MARRSDHTRQELEALILNEGSRLMGEVGLAHFSAREVAKRVGYAVGTVMNVYGSIDGLVMAVNTYTFTLWTQWLEARLEGVSGTGRIDVLIDGYFGFAAAHPNLWSAIYGHRLPDGMELPEPLAEERGQLMQVVSREVHAILPPERQEGADRLARSLVATVHGHCSFALGGSFALMGETNPLELARDRVGEILAANGRMGRAR